MSTRTVIFTNLFNCHWCFTSSTSNICHLLLTPPTERIKIQTKPRAPILNFSTATCFFIKYNIANSSFCQLSKELLLRLNVSNYNEDEVLLISNTSLQLLKIIINKNGSFGILPVSEEEETLSSQLKVLSILDFFSCHSHLTSSPSNHYPHHPRKVFVLNRFLLLHSSHTSSLSHNHADYCSSTIAITEWPTENEYLMRTG